MRKQITMETEKMDSLELQIIEAIETSDRDKLPFDLPPEVRWPAGSKEKSARAMLLMRVGYQTILEKYSSQISVPPTKAESESESLKGWS
jgi:hypothetical protein